MIIAICMLSLPSVQGRPRELTESRKPTDVLLRKSELQKIIEE